MKVSLFKDIKIKFLSQKKEKRCSRRKKDVNFVWFWKFEIEIWVDIFCRNCWKDITFSLFLRKNWFQFFSIFDLNILAEISEETFGYLKRVIVRNFWENEKYFLMTSSKIQNNFKSKWKIFERSIHCKIKISKNREKEMFNLLQRYSKYFLLQSFFKPFQLLGKVQKNFEAKYLKANIS